MTTDDRQWNRRPGNREVICRRSTCGWSLTAKPRLRQCGPVSAAQRRLRLRSDETWRSKVVPQARRASQDTRSVDHPSNGSHHWATETSGPRGLERQRPVPWNPRSLNRSVSQRTPKFGSSIAVSVRCRCGGLREGSFRSRRTSRWPLALRTRHRAGSGLTPIWRATSRSERPRRIAATMARCRATDDRVGHRPSQRGTESCPELSDNVLAVFSHPGVRNVLSTAL
jgi:hypothetical protein